MSNAHELLDLSPVCKLMVKMTFYFCYINATIIIVSALVYQHKRRYRGKTWYTSTVYYLTPGKSDVCLFGQSKFLLDESVPFSTSVLRLNWLSQTYISPSFPSHWNSKECSKVFPVFTHHENTFSGFRRVRQHLHHIFSLQLHHKISCACSQQRSANLLPQNGLSRRA